MKNKLRFFFTFLKLAVILYIVVNPQDEITQILAVALLPMVFMSMYNKLDRGTWEDE